MNYKEQLKLYIMKIWQYLAISISVVVLLACKDISLSEKYNTLSSAPMASERMQLATKPSEAQAKILPIIPGAENLHHYYPLIDDKNIALVVNQTSRIGNEHLVDSLLNLNIRVKKLFAPEHGIRGKADAGEHVKSGKDARTGLPIISLYGKHKKPTKLDLAGIDAVVFDIQDVGVRFYTYISTLHYVMEACAEQGIPIVVLDRPNPNVHYVDGPVLRSELKSFVGMHPVPIVYGMTIGEYALMINGERWLKNGVKADLSVIKCGNYFSDSYYDLPIKPSPNLPNIKSIYLYPSLCFFEGTTVSVGRGTNKQFQVVGHPQAFDYSYSFTPEPNEGAKHPKHSGDLCQGIDLSTKTVGSLRDAKIINLEYFLDFHKNLTKQGIRFWNSNNFFDKLAGTYDLRKQIERGWTEKQIRDTWKKDIENFRVTRDKYLIYK